MLERQKEAFKQGANTRKVRNATTGKEYETITDASKDVGVTVEAIRMALVNVLFLCHAGFSNLLPAWLFVYIKEV